MKLIAKKPCSFGGEKFYIGNEIPLDLVLDPKAQEQMGVLGILNDDAADNVCTGILEAGPETITVTAHSDGGDMPIVINAVGLQSVVDILTANKVDEAEAIVNQMTDNDALYLVFLADKRKTIKDAAKAKAKALSEESEGEQ